MVAAVLPPSGACAAAVIDDNTINNPPRARRRKAPDLLFATIAYIPLPTCQYSVGQPGRKARMRLTECGSLRFPGLGCLEVSCTESSQGRSLNLARLSRRSPINSVHLLHLYSFKADRQADWLWKSSLAPCRKQNVVADVTAVEIETMGARASAYVSVDSAVVNSHNHNDTLVSFGTWKSTPV